jgi:hypothetical protein
MLRTSAVSWADQVHKGSGANAGGDDVADTSRRFVGSRLDSKRNKMTSIVSAFLAYLNQTCVANRATIVRHEMSKYRVKTPMTYLQIVAAHAHARQKFAAQFDAQHAEFSRIELDLPGPILRLRHILFPDKSFTERRIVLFTLGLFIRLRLGCRGLWPRQRAFRIFGRRLGMLILAGKFTAKEVQSRALQVLGFISSVYSNTSIEGFPVNHAQSQKPNYTRQRSCCNTYVYRKTSIYIYTLNCLLGIIFVIAVCCFVQIVLFICISH